MADDNKLVKQETALTTKKSPFSAKKVGLAAKLEEQKANFDPLKCKDKVFLLVDDSGSMGGKKLQDAKKAVSEFLRVCDPNNVAIGLYSFNPDKHYNLSCDFIALDVLKEALQADYGTPFYGTLNKMFEEQKEMRFTRVVALSDGSPTDSDPDAMFHPEPIPGKIIQKYIDGLIPIDTVYIGQSEEDSGAKTLKQIATWTGGIFLHFKDSGTFAKAFKYLAPAFRAMLTDGNFRAQIEKGL